MAARLATSGHEVTVRGAARQDGGHCFAWRNRIVAGEAVSHERRHSCCDPGCARGGGAIDDDPVVINFQPPR